MFRRARDLLYVAMDIEIAAALDGAQVATYATAVRVGGRTNGEALGALGIFFDWQPQAETVVIGVRLSAEEKPRTRCLLLDSRHRVIAASDRRGILTEMFPLAARGGSKVRLWPRQFGHDDRLCLDSKV